MNTLKVIANVSQLKEIDIPIPYYARRHDEREYIGLLDEKTLVTIYKGFSHTSVSNTEIDTMEKSKILEAWEKWVSCTETEFLEKYDTVIESISLHPKLAV